MSLVGFSVLLEGGSVCAAVPETLAVGSADFESEAPEAAAVDAAALCEAPAVEAAPDADAESPDFVLSGGFEFAARVSKYPTAAIFGNYTT